MSKSGFRRSLSVPHVARNTLYIYVYIYEIFACIYSMDESEYISGVDARVAFSCARLTLIQIDQYIYR